jgi:putative DNA primase/helicase
MQSHIANADHGRHLPLDIEIDQERRVESALRLWVAARPLRDTLGARYFTERRRLHIGTLDDLSHALRWHPGINAVVALMTDAISGTATGIHRTFIDKSAAKIRRKMLGRSGVIRLSPDTEVNQGLGICEGLEDGLAILLAGWRPVWVATSAGAIRRFPILFGVESLTIFSDDGKVGTEAAQECAARWREAGVEVLIASPGGNDD